jgi:hypothetical protein
MAVPNDIRFPLFLPSRSRDRATFFLSIILPMVMVYAIRILLTFIEYNIRIEQKRDVTKSEEGATKRLMNNWWISPSLYYRQRKGII